MPRRRRCPCGAISGPGRRRSPSSAPAVCWRRGAGSERESHDRILTLLRPLWFLAIPVVALLALRAAWRSAPLGDWNKAADPHLMALAARRGAVLGGRRQANLAAALAAGILALALTGPAVERPEASTFRNLDATVIVLDLSRSVTEGGRFKEARQAAEAVGRPRAPARWR